MRRYQCNCLTLETWFFCCKSVCFGTEWISFYYFFSFGSSSRLTVRIYLVVYCLFNGSSNPHRYPIGKKRMQPLVSFVTTCTSKISLANLFLCFGCIEHSWKKKSIQLSQCSVCIIWTSVTYCGSRSINYFIQEMWTAKRMLS